MLRRARRVLPTVAAAPATALLSKPVLVHARPAFASSKAVKPQTPAAGLPVADFNKLRLSELAELKAKSASFTAYPDNFRTTLTVPEYIAKYSSLEAKARLTDVEERLTGRIVAKRVQSKALVFYDIVSGGERVQVLCTKKSFDAEADFDINGALRIGDIVGVRGRPGKSQTGELSIVPRELRLLAPCLHEIPAELSDADTRYRQRYLDMLVHPAARLRTVRVRAAVVARLRAFLQQRHFVEVETPILWPKHGGASARPFVTASRAFGTDLPLRLRIAPELFLKELVVGGLDRVFEIGKVFRNEGVDANHNPEFTTCEFYQAYADYEQLMDLTQDLLRDIVRGVKAVGGSDGSSGSSSAADLKVSLPAAAGSGSAAGTVIDFGPAFARVEVIPALEKALGVQLPDPNAESSVETLLKICSDKGIAVSKPFTPAHIIDKLIGHYIEPTCVQPTFLIHHPECMSPLAKSHPSKPGLTQRFELFIAGQEVANAYSELNDPQEQRRRMQQQVAARAAGDEEAAPPDEDFCKALEYGLPPTAGWGLGIDRLCMLLAGHSNIRDVVLFPIMRPKDA